MSEEPKSGPIVAPIVELEYRHGTNVVQIGDLRTARGEVRRKHSQCEHLSVIYSVNERRVYCTDCEQDVEPFDAFLMLVRRHDFYEKRIEELRAIEAETIISRATKKIDKMYRSRSLIPACPHCKQGILPMDVLKKMSPMSRDLEERRRGLQKSPSNEGSTTTAGSAGDDGRAHPVQRLHNVARIHESAPDN